MPPVNLRLLFSGELTMNPSKSKLVSVVIILLVAGVAVSGTAWAWAFLLGQRAFLQAQEAALEQLPETAARHGAGQAELEKRRFDIERVQSFLVTKDQIGMVVTEIEQAGAAAGVEVSVPAVEEKQEVDADGNPVVASGPLYQVRLKIVATGRPAKLLAFLHAIEHIQRLVYFESFRLDGSDETARNQARALRQAETDATERLGLLTVDMVVAVVREAGAGGGL